MSESEPGTEAGTYEQYLQRFDEALGPVAVGGFAKHNGQLVQKLSPEQFEEQRAEFQQLYATYQRAMMRGDTINDMVVRMLRESAAKLMQKAPAEF
jgi:hypothetical protein